jgi:isohexenylglutaconyl-CoA hydratase
MNRPYETLELERQDGWLTLWFNRPEIRNALSAQMVTDLSDALDAIEKEPEIRGVTLRGRGGVFCAGGDLKGFDSVAQDSATELAAVVKSSRDGGTLFARLNSLPKVVIALVEGAAMAGGLGMVCCADVVAVRSDAQFALTETTLGIPPAQIAPFVVERTGLRTARRLMLTAARFTGADALALGLADFVAEDAAALATIEAELRRQVLRCAPGANAATKELLLATRHLSGPDMLDFAASAFARCLLGEEGREGIAAFLEKRKPAWTIRGPAAAAK